MVSLIVAYILYGWCCRYLTYRKGENERRKAKLMAEMKRNMGMEKEETRLELAHCDKENTVRTRDVRESNGETVSCSSLTSLSKSPSASTIFSTLLSKSISFSTTLSTLLYNGDFNHLLNNTV